MAIVEGRKGVKWSYVQLWFVFPLFLPTHICSSKSKSLPLLLTRVVSPPLSSRGDLSARDSLDTPLLFAPALILHARVYPYVKTEKGLWSRICIEFIKKKKKKNETQAGRSVRCRVSMFGKVRSARASWSFPLAHLYTVPKLRHIDPPRGSSISAKGTKGYAYIVSNHRGSYLDEQKGNKVDSKHRGRKKKMRAREACHKKKKMVRTIYCSKKKESLLGLLSRSDNTSTFPREC